MSKADDPQLPGVSVLGLGLMGAALARSFLQKGFDTTVWNRSIQKAEPFTGQGAHIASTAAACANASPLVVLCLTNFDAVQAVLKDDEFCMEDKTRVLVNFTSGSPSQIRSTSQLARERGFAAYVHGSIMTFPQGVGSPEAFIYFSGDHEAYQSVEKALDALGTPIYLGDDATSSAIQEVMVTGAAYGSWMGVLQSIALLKTTGAFKSGAMSAQGFVDRVIQPLMSENMKVFRTMAREIDEGNYKTNVDGAKCSVHLASLRTFSQTYQEQGLSSECLEPMIKLLEKQVAEGGGDDELSAIVNLIPK